MGFRVTRVNPDFSDNGDILLGVLRRTKSESGYSTCLVSGIEFKGNARFKLGELFVYPSIQASIWAAVLGEVVEESSKLGDQAIGSLLRWPALDSGKRQTIARVLGLEYYPASRKVSPTNKFNSLVHELFELAQDFVIPQVEPSFISIEKYLETWEKDPSLLLLEGENLDLAIASRSHVSEHLARLSNNHASGVNKDFTRVMTERMANVLTQQKSIQSVDPTRPDVYLTIMESLGVRRALISDTKFDVNYLRRKTPRATYTVYFSGPTNK
jgi:hypothetical protein